MSSPSSRNSTPRRSGRNSRASSDANMDSSSVQNAGTQEEPSSDLAQPLPPSPTMGPPAAPATPSQSSVAGSGSGLNVSVGGGGGGGGMAGPGSVMVSEIDLSSPLNYGTPGSGSLRTPRSGSTGGVSGVRATPIRIRADIQSEKTLRQVSMTPGGTQMGTPAPSEAPSSTSGGTPSRRGRRGRGASQPPPSSQPPSDAVPPSESSEQASNLVVWGTDVSVASVRAKFKRFIETFMVADAEEDERMDGYDRSEPFYLQKLEEIETLGSPYFNVNAGHIREFNEDLYRQLICYPQEVIPAFDMSVNELFFEKYPDAVLSHQVQVMPFNADKTKNMRSLNPEDIDQLITITGMVTRTSHLVPELSEAFFRCSVCKSEANVEVQRGRIAEPTLCPNCNTGHSYALVHNRCQFQDKQMIKLQESPDDMPAGQTPHTVMLYAHDSMVDAVQPGDRVAVTGIYRAIPSRVSPLVRNIKSVYKTHIDVIHFRKTDTRRLQESNQEGGDLGDESCRPAALAQERVDLIEALAQKPDVYERLARAIAPSIYENEDIKKGILLQMFGGAKKDWGNTGRGGFRAEVNILLCGDPGTSKSQLLQYVFNLVPRSQYTSGKGSSAVGLTAYVTKDPETKQMVLQTGALVLADNGVCCIDEFDKMSDSARSVLHEVMEQQTLSIAKAGIICQLNARTSVLAAANPIESAWNPKKTIVENIQLPHTLMSRFDLIFLMLDPQDELYDKRLGRHLVSLYYRSAEAAEDEQLDMGILRDYLSYAKGKFPCPKLTEEAGALLVENYVRMRQVGSGRGQVTAFPRQLESLIRLAEAHAKMRLSDKVEVSDVEEANRLHREALKQSATDPMSGKIDVTILTTGQSEAGRKRRDEVKRSLREVIDKKGKKVQTINYLKTWNDLKEASDVMITRDMFEDALKDLSDDNVITLTGRTTIRINHL